MEQFGAAREQLYRKVEAHPDDPFLMTALSFADASLGRKEESIQEGRRAVEAIATDIAIVYAMVNEFDSAFEQLNIVIKLPNFLLTYGDLKTDPGWNPLRKDPRFDKLLAELAPRE